MFESFYGLSANPFRMSADEHFRFAHRAYVKAWSYLKYALVQGEGFVLITGRPGTGKTMLVRDTLSELDSERILPVNLVTHQLRGEELLRLVALELGYPAQEYNKATILTRIEQHALGLHREGRRVLVVVDEAQNLSTHGLEELRLLSNLQVGNKPLFQIVLIGQEELRSLIYGQGIENIQQRILTSCRLEPIASEQIRNYVEHRLGVAGWEGDPSFEPTLYPLVYRITHGVPREINLLMARLLLYGSLEQRHAFTKADLFVVLTELDQERRLAFDQTAVLAELQACAEAEEAPQEHEEDTEPQEDAAPDAISVAVDSPAEPMVEPMAEPEAATGMSREPVVTEEELPPLRALPDEEDGRPRGLLTDVDDLLASEGGIGRGMRRFWRWFFYPLAIALFLAALLVPQPTVMTSLWRTPPRQAVEVDEKEPDSGDQATAAPADAGTPEAPRRSESAQQEVPAAPPAAARPVTDSPPPEDEPAAQTAVSPASLSRVPDTAEASVDRDASDATRAGGADGAIEPDRPYYLVFEKPNDTLDDRSELRLAGLTAWLQANPATSIVITGILQAGQGPLERMHKALARAEQISARLISAGISSRRIFIEGEYQNHTRRGIGVSVKVSPKP